MSSVFERIVKSFKDAIQESNNRSTSPYDTQAEVVRVDGDTAWVHIPGGVDETPVQLTTSAKKGDKVQVRISGGRAWLYGNQTAPPTDDTKANAADTRAGKAMGIADQAWMEAESAHKAADVAWSYADDAHQAATSAQASANEAKRSADEANTQATYATNYANNALTQLSTVESVVDALTWISEHSVFVPTEDTTVQASKLYYMPNNNVLTLTSGTTTINDLTFVVDAESGTVTVNGTATQGTLFGLGVPNVPAGDRLWFSGVSDGSSNTYSLRYSNGPGSTQIYDGIGTAIAVSSGSNQNLNIYVYNNAVMENVVFTPKVSAENDGFDYQIVQNPTGNPSAQGWYELSTDEAVKTYVQSHLALTNDGLYVLNDSSAYKMLLANDGMYIQAPNGQTVNQSTADGNVIRAPNGDVIAHLGYGKGTASSGTATAPYYTFGKRKTTSTAYSSSSTYSVGDLCVYNGSVYVCTTDISTPEAWNNEHWRLSIGNYSVAEGQNAIASGFRSHAHGSDTIAIGSDSYSGGTYNKSLGACSHSEGYGTTAIGNNSHSEGYTTTASGFASHSEGDTTTAGIRAHSEGYKTTASGGISHAEGSNCIASGNRSHAQNLSTIAGHENQTAIGKYNSNLDNTAFEIGNGTSDSARSNALTVDWSGNVNIASGATYKVNGSPLLDKYTRSSVGDLGWTSQTEGDAKVIAKSALAFWNGAYSGNSSNLSKCSTGNIIGSNGGTMTGQLLTSFKTSVAMGSYGSAQTTVDGLVGEVRFSSGCAGSASVNTAYTKDGVTIPTGWYNFMYMPHRSGGKNGSADGDNAQYGNLFLFGMNNTNGRFIVRVASNAIAEVSKIMTSIEQQRGTISATSVNANSYVDVSVTFPHAFKSTPVVVVGLRSDSTAGAIGSISAAVLSGSESTKGFKVRIFNAGSSARIPSASWIAML